MEAAMSDDTDTRLTLLEKGQVTLQNEVSGMKSEMKSNHSELMRAIATMKSENTAAVERLKETNATEIAKLNEQNKLDVRLKAFGTVVGSLMGVAAFVWFVISISPSVQGLGDRMTKLDDRDVGRVLRLEQDLRRQQESDKATVDTLVDHQGRLKQLEREMSRVQDALAWRPTIARSQ
jgi:hypothetical protein